MSGSLNISLAITFLSFYLAAISALLHNMVSGMIGKEDFFFFTLFMLSALIFPFAFVTSSVLWFNTFRRERGG